MGSPTTWITPPEFDDYVTTRERHRQVREDVGAGAHYVRVKGKPNLYTLVCWAAPAPVYKKE